MTITNGDNLETITAEQEARNLLERMGVEDAQSFLSGEVTELANLITLKRKVDRFNESFRRVREQLRWELEGDK